MGITVQPGFYRRAKRADDSDGMLVGRYKVCRTNLLVSVKGRKFARFGVLKPEGQSNNRIGGIYENSPNIHLAGGGCPDLL